MVVVGVFILFVDRKSVVEDIRDIWIFEIFKDFIEKQQVLLILLF